MCVRFSSHKEERSRKRMKAKDEGTRYELSSCHAGQLYRLISKSDQRITGRRERKSKKKRQINHATSRSIKKIIPNAEGSSLDQPKEELKKKRKSEAAVPFQSLCFLEPTTRGSDQ